MAENNASHEKSVSTSGHSELMEVKSFNQTESASLFMFDIECDRETQNSVLQSPVEEISNQTESLGGLEALIPGCAGSSGLATPTRRTRTDKLISNKNSIASESCSMQSDLPLTKISQRFKKANPITTNINVHNTNFDEIKQNEKDKKFISMQIKESKYTITETQLDTALKEILNNTQKSDSINSQKSDKMSKSYETKVTLSIKIHQDQCKDQEEPVNKDQGTAFSESDSQCEVLREIALQSIDLNVATCSHDKRPISLITKLSFAQNSDTLKSMAPLIVIKNPSKSRPSETAVPSQLRSKLSISSIIPAISTMTTVPNQPPSLFLQALAKLDQSEYKAEICRILRSTLETISSMRPDSSKRTRTPSSELSPPDSLTSAPPSYSFVLRQTAVGARPRLMGTFMSSPSYVQRAPPPNYATAFDIYSDCPLPSQPAARVYNFGFSEIPVVCPTCGYTGLTVVYSKVTFYTHLCSCLLCLFCCWACAPLPYILRSCKDVYHYCRNCRALLGMYRPSNPGTSFSVSVPTSS